MSIGISLNKFRDWLLAFCISRRGIAALETALCLPLLVIFFYEYLGFSQNFRLLSDLERATASLGDVLANPALKPTDSYIEKVMSDGSEISKEAIGWAFEQMVGRPGVHGVVRVAYSDSASTETVWNRVILVNPVAAGGDCAARNPGALAKPREQLPTNYEGGVLVVDACIVNPVKDFSLLTDILFPEQYSSTFVAPRRK